jgi:hypothetical protein
VSVAGWRPRGRILLHARFSRMRRRRPRRSRTPPLTRAATCFSADAAGGGDVRRSLPDVLRCRVGFMRGSLCRRHGGGKAAGLSLGEERVGTVSRKGGKAAVLCVMCVMGNTGRGGRSYLGSLRLGRED